jgi:hypothetical protein
MRHHPRMGRIAVCALVGVVGLTFAGAAASPAARDSGVAGRVAVGAPCTGVPGIRCDAMGVPATIRVERARSGRRVRTVHADDGRFRIRLRPGRYRLRASADSGNGTGSARVRVKRHQFASVVIDLHSPQP